jgi:hypothetical protein
MATSLIDDASPEGFIEPRPGWDGVPHADRAEWLWTLFGATLLAAFLSYIALTST